MRFVRKKRLGCVLAGAALLALAIQATASAKEPPVPALPAVTPIPVKVIVVANFEPGEDMGDAPGEFQLWAEREKLTEVIPFRGGLQPLRRNADGLYGVRWGSPDSLMGGVAEQLMSLLLDPRFDFTKTYWLFTGISGADPEVASVGSAAWARWVVQGDTLREFDDREVPKDWPYGLFAIGAKAPNKLPDNPDSFAGMTDAGKLNMALKLNPGLARWAFDMTKDTPIPDSPELQKARAAWKGFPNAQRPPFVLMGETLGALRYWHGPSRTQWARDWVKLWTGGQGVFAMTNMESQSLAGTMMIASKQGLVDMNRVLVLRTASNPSTPPPGLTAVESVGDEGPGQLVAYESNYRVGAPVVHELLKNWGRYRDAVPGAAHER
ncbi:purine nucleoside permease [Phenylobacterium sp. LjRoot225]|uniref:purine nucleoside permease n=1 Tax=Phenylobacterium sp. LjRoot225 TaxID=3342285 RepID=UPI003ECEA809